MIEATFRKIVVFYSSEKWGFFGGHLCTLSGPNGLTAQITARGEPNAGEMPLLNFPSSTAQSALLLPIQVTLNYKKAKPYSEIHNEAAASVCICFVRCNYIVTPSCQNTIFQVIKNLIITNNAIVTAVKWIRPNNDQQARFHTLTVNTIIKTDNEADKYESRRITLTNKLPLASPYNRKSLGGKRCTS